MCGIAGMIQLEGDGGSDIAVLERMLDGLEHRGPDDRGTVVGRHAALGSQRLAIVDLITGRQPIANGDGTVQVVLNGEIYSHVELREQLIAEGHRFRTGTDTEVLVHGYETWGIEGLLKRIDGMYAFALYDERTGVAYLARDRMGIKPLVYARRGATLYFASTIAALRASGHVPVEPDPLGVRLYLRQQFISGPVTAVRDVHKLPPATYIEVRDGQIIGPTSYCQLPTRTDRKEATEWRELLRSLIEDAVRKRMRADVPVGVFLSGGLDSSIVLGLMKRHAKGPVHAFNVRLPQEKAFDESAFAQQAATRFGADLHFVDLDPSRLRDDIDGTVRHLGEPIGDAACIPTYCVSREARRHVKVALSGEGSDELFSGYGYYRHVASPTSRTVRRVKRFVRGAEATASSGYPYVMGAGDVERLTPSLGRAQDLRSAIGALESRWTRGGRTDPINEVSRLDIGAWLVDDLLMKVDATSMAHGLEARVPFLDHHVVEAAMAVPGEYKRRGRAGKIILRDTFRDLIGPELSNRDKHGFSLPLASWLRGPLRPLLEQMVSRLPSVPWLDRGDTERLVAEHQSGRDRSRALWSLYVLVTWFCAMQELPSLR